MKTTITLNGVTQEVELTAEQAKLFEKPNTGWERTGLDEEYFFID